MDTNKNSGPTSGPQRAVEEAGASQQDKIRIGSECATQTLYEGPKNCACCINWVDKYPDDLQPPIDRQEQTKQKAVVVRMRKDHEEGTTLKLDSVVVQNRSLKEALAKVFDGYQGITPSLDKLVFRTPFWPFYHRWVIFEEVLQRQKLEDPESASYTQLLYNVLDDELRASRAEVDNVTSQGMITYPLLWAIFKPGTRVIATRHDQPGRFFLVDSCAYQRDRLDVNLKFVDWDGNHPGYNSTKRHINHFGGTRGIKTLDLVPVNFYPSRQEAEPKAIARGRRFMELCGFHYVSYSGPFKPTSHGRLDEYFPRRLDGRIIVDAAACFEKGGNLRPVLVPLSPEFLAPHIEIEDRRHIDHSYTNDFEMTPGGMPPKGVAIEEWWYQRRLAIKQREIDERTAPTPTAGIHSLDPLPELTDEQLLLCNSHVHGFSLNIHQWGHLEVDSIHDIVWNDQAFSHLMLPDGYKDLVLSFVEGQKMSMCRFDDIIDGKGLGLNVLLVGNPGTGKTLTAEAVADKVRRPLYVFSAGELCQPCATIDYRLKNVLELTERWDAVLLFDECDFFFQERSKRHLDHNESVAVILRVLDYYQGVILITSSSTESIDRAFESRIHLTLRYPDLQASTREHIWRHFVAQLAETNIPDEVYSILAKVPVNGRQIRNAVKSATLLAAQQDAHVGVEQIRTVLRAIGQAVGEEFSPE